MTIPNTVVFSKPATAVPTAPQLVEYKLTTAASEPGGIVAGPDGALWFVETTVNKIGRISTDGVVTEYAVPTAGAIDQDQRFLTVGPDGALWFVEDSVDQIGRITLDGKLTEYALPKNVKALRMTVGPDKAM